MIGIYSDERDVQGRPTLQWEMNAQDGRIVETRRTKDGEQVKVVEKDGFAGSRRPTFYDSVLDKNGKVIQIDGQSIDEQMQDIEKQRDIAFKIMFFFISFMLCTFAALYGIFRHVENNRQEAVLKQGIKNQRVISPQDQQKRTFMDFIVGNLDDDSMVINPYARSTGPISVGPINRMDRKANS